MNFMENNQAMLLPTIKTSHLSAGPCNRFLRLLADYEWMFYPLIVDINNDFGRNDEKEINVSPNFNNGSSVGLDLLERPYVIVKHFWYF